MNTVSFSIGGRNDIALALNRSRRWLSACQHPRLNRKRVDAISIVAFDPKLTAAADRRANGSIHFVSANFADRYYLGKFHLVRGRRRS
jgi:hypothetical protein